MRKTTKPKTESKMGTECKIDRTIIVRHHLTDDNVLEFPTDLKYLVRFECEIHGCTWNYLALDMNDVKEIIFKFPLMPGGLYVGPKGDEAAYIPACIICNIMPHSRK